MIVPLLGLGLAVLALVVVEVLDRRGYLLIATRVSSQNCFRIGAIVMQRVRSWRTTSPK